MSEIIDAIKSGESQSAIARRYGLSRQRINQIARKCCPELCPGRGRKRIKASPELKYCRVCGKQIKRRRYRYCSDACYQKRGSLKEPQYEKVCPVCNSRFRTHYDWQINCSHKCARLQVLRKTHGSDYVPISLEEKRRRNAERFKHRYNTDEAFRERMKARNRDSMRQRYADDPVYRERRNAMRREHYRAKTKRVSE